MELNPIKLISAELERLVIEHGSAVVQEKHIALFRDQLALADKSITKLESEITTLKDQLKDSQTTIAQLTKENAELKQKIQSNQKTSQLSILPDPQIKILQTLATLKGTQMYPLESIMSACGLSEQQAQYHLEELEDNCMIVSADIGSIRVWELDHDGRGYLIEHNLLS